MSVIYLILLEIEQPRQITFNSQFHKFSQKEKLLSLSKVKLILVKRIDITERTFEEKKQRQNVNLCAQERK